MTRWLCLCWMPLVLLTAARSVAAQGLPDAAGALDAPSPETMFATPPADEWAGGAMPLGPALHGGGKREYFRSSANSPRFTGHGEPLVGSSWLNRPANFSLLVGPLFNDEPIHGRVDLGSSVLFGFRFGADFDHYWGGELRFAFSGANVYGVQNVNSAEIFLGDVSLLYYPWGDSRIRPYLLLGVGMANFDFVDHNYHGRDIITFGMPWGGGVKYQVHPRVALRLELLDNLAFANDGLNTMHNVGLTFNVEYRFGGTRRSYFPWQPSRHPW